MKKIPFNLESWLADKSQKVVTSDGHSARIICTDAKSTGENPDRILALISADSGFENALFYTRDGWCLSDSSQHRKKDLFLVTPDPELTEFERAVFDCIDETVVSYIDDYTPDTRVDLIQAQFEKWSPKLLAIASKQIEAERIAVVGNTIDEDERIRRELVKYIKDYPNLPNGHYSRADFFAYLEKQKESLHIPEICKENADSFTDEDERIRKELIDFFVAQVGLYPGTDRKEHRWLRWLEKQKEQQEVNCDFYNKELSDIVSAELYKYSGYNSIKSPWALDSTGVQYPLYFANLGAKWQKKQKSGEWNKEDEKIRNEIEQTLTMFVADNDSSLHPGAHYTVNEAIAWLEKQKDNKFAPRVLPCSAAWFEDGEERQKEQKPNYCHYGGDPNVERCKLCSAVCIGRLTEDQKPVEWSEVELEFRGEKVKVKRPFFRDDKGRGYSTTEQDEDVAWNALRAWCEKKGVSLYDLYPREKWDEVDETKLRDVIRIVEDSGYIKSIQEHYKEFLSSLPERFNLRPVKQEWSEDEQTVIDCVVDVLEKDGLSSLAASVRHLRPQPKQEWSDEDDEIFNNIIEKAKGGHWIEVNEITWLINRFKSLRPRPHKEVYQAAKHDLAIKFMNYLDENRPEGKMCLSNVECEDIDKAFKENDWVKIMRYVEKYHPHWKPSEEQMEALFTAASEAPIIKENGNYLYDLYNDLKKLM